MTHSTRISVPSNLAVGDTVQATIRIACMEYGDVKVSFGLGSKHVNDSDRDIRKETTHTEWFPYDGERTFEFEVTEEMVQKQREGRLNGIWATQTTGDGIATAYFKVITPEAIMGEVRIFRSYSCRQGSRGYIATWYLDRYYDGIATDINYCFGDGYARPSCRIMDEYTGEYTRKYKYIRQSLYDKRATNPEEKEWMDTNLIVVPNDWTPMDGVPEPPIPEGVITYTSWAAYNPITGEKSPVAYWGYDVNVLVDAKNVGKKQGNYKIQIWRGETFLSESNVFTLDVDEQKGATLSFVMPEVSSLHITVKLISTDEPESPEVPEEPPLVCTEGEKKNPMTCWDESVVHEIICEDGEWIPTGEECPIKPEPEPTPGEFAVGDIVCYSTPYPGTSTTTGKVTRVYTQDGYGYINIYYETIIIGTFATRTYRRVEHTKLVKRCSEVTTDDPSWWMSPTCLGIPNPDYVTPIKPIAIGDIVKTPAINTGRITDIIMGGMLIVHPDDFFGFVTAFHLDTNTVTLIKRKADVTDNDPDWWRS